MAESKETESQILLSTATEVVHRPSIAGFVYFAQAGVSLFKIGWARNVKLRIRHLQTACPVRLRLIDWIPGDRALERRLHAVASDSRTRGEWFRPSPELRDAIRSELGDPKLLRGLAFGFSSLLDLPPHQRERNVDDSDARDWEVEQEAIRQRAAEKLEMQRARDEREKRRTHQCPCGAWIKPGHVFFEHRQTCAIAQGVTIR